jgi:hypothetical protein
VPVRG